MKLTLDFNGKTLLKDWWGQIKALFQETEDAINAEEVSRISGDSELQNNIDAEAAERTSRDNELQSNINEEISAREADFNRAYDKAQEGVDAAERANNGLNAEKLNRISADNMIKIDIANETSERKSADSALNLRMTAVEGKAHDHANKSAIDTITAEDIEQWNGIKSQVTQTQLDEAVSAEANARKDNIVYVNDIFSGIIDEFKRVYAAVGVILAEGGIFGMEQNDTALDGGDFVSENLTLFDCGGFETAAAALATLDGGNY